MALRLNPDDKLFLKNWSEALISSKQTETKDVIDERVEIIRTICESIDEQKPNAGKTPHMDLIKLFEQMIDKCMKKASNTTKTDTKK